MKKLKSEFYEYFKDNTIEEVNASIIVTKSTKKVEKYFGIDSKTHNDKEKELLISNLKETINKGYIYKKTIFSYLPNMSRIDVLKIINKLSSYSKKIIFKFCSLEENSDLIEDLGDNYLLYLKKFNNLLKIIEGKSKSFYSLFPEYTKEEILTIMDALYDYEKYIIFKKHGINLLGDGIELTEEDENNYKKVIAKIKRYLKFIKEGRLMRDLTDLYPELTLDEIKFFIDELTEKQKNYFYNLFGKHLDKKRIVIKEEQLIASENKNALDLIIYYKSKYNSFYSYFPLYTKEEILYCMDLLNEYEKYLIFKKFGPNLLGNGMYVTPKENKIIGQNINRKIKGYLSLVRNGYNILGLNDLYPELTLEEIKEKVDLLPTKTKEHFYNIFGEHLDKKRLVPKTRITTYKSLIVLDKIINYKGRTLRPFFLIFDSFRKKDESLEEFKTRIIETVYTLKPNCLEITKHIYGENFDLLITSSNISKKELKYFYSVVVPSIKRRLGKTEYEELKRKKRIENSYSRKFFELFPLFTRNDENPIFSYERIYEELNLLSEKEKEVLIKRYGENLDEIKTASKSDFAEINTIIKKIRTKIYSKLSSSLNINIYKINKIVSLYSSYLFKENIINIDINIAVSVLAYLYIDDISLKEIISILRINPIEHLENVKSILEEKGISKKMVL